MYQTSLKIDGMACSMCESHVNDAVRKAFPVKKVTSSHSKGETVILSEQPLEEAAVRAAIEPTGYGVLAFETKPYEKTGLFHCVMRPHSTPCVRGGRGGARPRAVCPSQRNIPMV